MTVSAPTSRDPSVPLYEKGPVKMIFYPIWEGVYPYKDVEARIQLSSGWKMLLFENDGCYPCKEFFKHCSFEEWESHKRKWRGLRARGGQYRIPQGPLYGISWKANDDMLQYLIFPAILPRRHDSGSIEDCTVGFRVFIKNLSKGTTGEARYFVKVEGSEKP